MSYQSSLKVIECNVQIRAKDVRKALRIIRESENGDPDSNFIGSLLEAADDAEDGNALLTVADDRCWWIGNYAGRADIEPIAKFLIGRLSGYFVGEDGEIADGFQIMNGVYRECAVVVSLTPRPLPGETLIAPPT